MFGSGKRRARIAPMASVYLDDVKAGDRYPAGSAQITEADAIAFARSFDPQPMHTDPAWALEGPFKGLIASGWHTVAVAMRLTVESRMLGETPLLGIGVDRIEWPNPVRPGDTISAEIEILSVTPSRSKPGFGIVKMRITGSNQDGKPVLIMQPNCWVPRRPA